MLNVVSLCDSPPEILLQVNGIAFLNTKEQKCNQNHFMGVCLSSEILNTRKHKNKNSVTLVRQRTIATERPPLVSEVRANVCYRRGHVSSVTDPYDVLSAFWTGAATFSFKLLLSCTHEAECTSFQTHCFSENLCRARNRTQASGSVTRNSDH
jgi:hypothetical protein